MAEHPWPEGCQGAVSLTFDDGLRSQLEVAVPILERYGLRGTFYLNPRGPDWEERLRPWQEVARAGHELGNHTMAHPCSEGFDFVAPGQGLESLTLEDIARDIDEAETRLRRLTGVEARSFAYPCYQDYVGTGSSRQSYVPVVARRFVAARIRGEVANHPLRCDLHHLWSWPAERMSGAEMIGLCEEGVAQGRWCVFTFHGVGDGHLPIAAFDLEALCRHLAHSRDRIFTAPVVDVAQRLVAWRAARGGKEDA